MHATQHFVLIEVMHEVVFSSLVLCSSFALLPEGPLLCDAYHCVYGKQQLKRGFHLATVHSLADHKGRGEVKTKPKVPHKLTFRLKR